MSKFYEVADTPIAAAPREDRQFLHTQQAGVVVPLLQSLATAGIFGLTMFAMAILIGLIDPWKHGIVMAMISGAGWWLVSLVRWMNLTKRDQTQVQISSVDHDGDPATPRIVRVQLDSVTDGRYQQKAIFDLPATEGQLSDLAVGLLKHGRPFSEREWTGAGRTFSVKEFRALRSELIRRSLMVLKNDKDSRQGYDLTDEGKAVFEQFMV